MLGLSKVEDYLELRFKRNEKLEWTIDGEGFVRLSEPHKGFVAGLAERIFGRARVNNTRLDKYGSIVWLSLAEKDNITDILADIKEHFGETMEPIVEQERLIEFIKMMLKYEVIERK